MIGSTDYSDASGSRPGNGRWCNSPPAPAKEGGCNNIRVWDCDILQVAVNPACSFSVADEWTTKINTKIKDHGG